MSSKNLQTKDIKKLIRLPVGELILGVLLVIVLMIIFDNPNW